jgi:hypothetical protein
MIMTFCLPQENRFDGSASDSSDNSDNDTDNIKGVQYIFSRENMI